MGKFQKNIAGFTLLELMIVVMIAAVLAAIAIPSYQAYIAKAHKSKAQSEMLKIAERLENYKGKQLSYAGYIPDHQAATKGEINIPYDSGTDFDYQIKLVDINDSSIALEDSAIGQGWKMIAVPNQLKGNSLRASQYLLLDSRGLKCMTKDALTVSSTTCTNWEDWR